MHSPTPSMAPSTEANGAIKPKIMRRPAQFSAAPSLPAIVDHSDTPVHPLPIPTHVAWQDDARFGVVLVLALIVINIALMAWIPSIRIHGLKEVPAMIAVAPTAQPRATTAEVTLYTQPQENRRTVHLFNLNEIGESQNRLSVSPRDVPAPTAQALEKTSDGTSNQ